ncbi:hypothetical protein FG05_35278 [Fusarium graminearum]|nr:hypothetical protein FG05_35278 [Fusarium graminearum]
MSLVVWEGPDSRQLRNGMEPLLQGDIADLGGM